MMHIEQLYALIDRIKAAIPGARQAVIEAIGTGLLDEPNTDEDVAAGFDAVLARALVPEAEYASRAWDM